MVAHSTRWINHINKRLEYERAYLDAVGGSELLKPTPRRVSAAPDDGLKKGDTVSFSMGYYQQGTQITGKILSMGPLSVRVSVPDEYNKNGYYNKGAKIGRTRVTKVLQ